jgi:DNA-binding beta-propeller fold protein YncE
VSYLRLGEGDPGAVVGATATNTIDSAGPNNLRIQGNARYTSDVAPAAATSAASSLSVNFTNSAYAANTIVSTATDNFGIECWVKPTALGGGQVIAYNGSTANSGWGLIIAANNTYEGLLGGANAFGTNAAIANVWTHLALVCASGNLTLYVNGVPSASLSSGIFQPGGNFGLGAPPQSPTSQFFTGLIDEVRVFTFAAGQFNTNDLFFFAAVSPKSLAEGPAGGNDSVQLAVPAGQSWTATANSFWLHLSPQNQSGVGSANIIFSFDANPGAMRVGTITIAGQTLTVTQGPPTYALGSTNLTEGPAAGTDNIALTVIPSIAPWTATANSFWLHLSPQNQSGVGSTNIIFSFDANPGVMRVGTITIANQTLTITQNQANPLLGTTAVAEGPGAGSDSVVLREFPTNASWTATPNATWLHVSTGNQSGTGSTNVVFNWDANPGPIRTGTISIAGQTLTVTQAGSSYVAAPGLVTTLVPSGLNSPSGVAVDAAGNVYIADFNNNAIKMWSATNNTTSTLPIPGLNQPVDVAVDAAGNLYIADSGSSTIKKWSAASSTLTNLVASGLSGPKGVAVDIAGNVYIADTSNNAIREWLAGSNTVIDLATSGLNGPAGVAVDAAGNVYVADTSNHMIKKWTPGNTNLTTIVSSGLNFPSGIAVDGSGSVYIADRFNSAIKKWLAASNSVSTLVSSNLNKPFGVAADTAGNVYIADSLNNLVAELPRAFVDPTPRAEIAGAGSDLLPVVLPTNENVRAPFSGTDQPWLSILGVTNGVVSFSYSDNLGPVRTGNIIVLGLNVPVLQGTIRYTLGTDSLLLGPGAASNSVVLGVTPESASWSASANDPWLHLSPEFQSGTGSTNVIFTLDANLGAARTGTLTIAGQTLTITQAGSTYVAAPPPATTVVSTLSDGRRLFATGLATDRAGNIYIADKYNGAVRKWNPTSNTVITLMGTDSPSSVAVDPAGNVYVADAYDNAVLKWSPADNSVTTIVSSGLSAPSGVAVDDLGDVYIADSGHNVIKKWTARNNSITTLISGLNFPMGVAVDAARNVYVADTINGRILKWTAANGNVSDIIANLLEIYSVAVDGAGNVYATGTFENEIVKWAAADGNISLVTTAPGHTVSVTADLSGNVYLLYWILDIYDPTGDIYGLQELPHAFVDPTPKVESQTAGSDALPMVIPSTFNLHAQFAPTTDQPWLTVNGVTDDIVSFSFTANPGPTNRTANITLLGQPIAVTQATPNYSAQPTTLLEGPTGGTDSAQLLVTPQYGLWTATANDTWLHLRPASQSGTGNATIVFDYDANAGPTRVGTLTVGNNALSITQAGANYVAAGPVTLAASGLFNPRGVAVDGQGNVFIADAGNNAIKMWAPANNSLTTVVSSGLNDPYGVAVDAAGNLYIADFGSSAIKKWTAADNTLTTLVSSGLNYPSGVAVDGANNVYIADTYNHAIKKWSASDGSLSNLVASGLDYPEGVAVDRAGNVYIADTYHSAIKEWSAADGSVTTLVSSGLADAYGVAVDASGNVYIADTFNSSIEKWSVATSNLTVLLSVDLSLPEGIALDSAGNIYIADSFDDVVKELPHAFLDPTARVESAAAGSDTLPVVLAATAELDGPFAPVSDQAWLTIDSVNNGVTGFSFSENQGPARTAHISLLGRTVPILQRFRVVPPVLTNFKMAGSGLFQFSFSNSQSISFSVVSSTNLSTPLQNWTVIGAPTNVGPGLYQFTAPANDGQRFYRIRSP